MFNKKIGFIGCGNMAGAIIRGISAKMNSISDINVFDIDVNKTDMFKSLGCTVCESEREVALNSDITFLAVKPQVIKSVLEKLGHASDTVYVSIAAGISSASIKRLLGYDAKVVCAMPNTPLCLSEGATATAKISPVSEEELEYVESIFRSCGVVERIDENLINSIISVNGSSPAYVYYLARAVRDGAREQGIDESVALKLFSQVLIGSAKMLISSGKTPDELIDMVCSKGGTTIEAVNLLDKYEVNNAVCEAMKACTRRANELDI